MLRALKRIFLFNLILIFCFTNKAYCERVLPIFSGSWYDRASIDYSDSCGRWHYNYENKMVDKAELIATIFSNLPERTNCQWGKPYYKPSTIELFPPVDFPGSNINDYRKVINLGNPRSEIWQIDCTEEF